MWNLVRGGIDRYKAADEHSTARQLGGHVNAQSDLLNPHSVVNAFDDFAQVSFVHSELLRAAGAIGLSEAECLSIPGERPAASGCFGTFTTTGSGRPGVQVGAERAKRNVYISSGQVGADKAKQGRCSWNLRRQLMDEIFAGQDRGVAAFSRYTEHLHAIWNHDAIAEHLE